MKTLALALLLATSMFAQQVPGAGGSCPPGEGPVCVCSDWDGVNDFGTFSYNLTDGTGHLAGSSHWLNWIEADSCTYANGPHVGTNNWMCIPTASSNYSFSTGDQQHMALGNVAWHFVTANAYSPTSTKPAAPYGTKVQGAIAMGVEGCLDDGSDCVYPAITFNLTSPPTATYSNMPNPVYYYQQPSHVQNCPQESATNGTPIVIPLDPATGYKNAFTDVAHGITWDWAANGRVVRMSWVDPTARVGILAMSRNNKGKGWDGQFPCDPKGGAKCPVRSGRELFGSLTNQVADESTRHGYDNQPYETNGFNALRKLTLAEFGGKGRTFIGPGDPAWPYLFVCVGLDPSTGICAENYTMDDLGISAISLDYHEAAGRDPNGNQFRFVGSMTMRGQQVPIVDVVFQIADAQ